MKILEKSSRLHLSLIILLLSFVIVMPAIGLTETIDVHIKGVDDGVKTTKQQDYKEAVLFAKREAIERAGVKIKSLTTAKDFIVDSDYIESKAEAVLMPGYNIIDVGYQNDGTYLVILIGKVSINSSMDEKSTHDDGAKQEAAILLDEHFIDNRNGWATGEWKAASATLRDRRYIITMKKDITVFYSKIDLAMNPEKSFSIEARVAKLSGDNEDPSWGYYGIIFGKDFKNMYEFCVHPSGRHMIRRQINGETSFVESSVPSPHVKRGNATNDFKIVKEGNMLSFYLNGQRLNTKEQGELLISNVNAIGYTVWKTPGKDLQIAGEELIVRQGR